MTEQEKIALLERLTASGAQIGQLNLGDGHQYYGCSVTQTSSTPSSPSKVMQVVDVLASSCDIQEPSANPYSFVVLEEKAEQVIELIKHYAKGKSQPKMLMMPVRAALEAGAIIRVSHADFLKVLPEYDCMSKSTYNRLLKIEEVGTHPYADDTAAFQKMVDDFKKLMNE